MRIAVISDIHGNCLALEAVLDDIARQSVDTTLDLGDLLSGPIEPRRTADLLLECDFLTVRGNHERSLMGEAPGAVDSFARRDLLAGAPRLAAGAAANAGGRRRGVHVPRHAAQRHHAVA